jgi:hypothetical protein
VTRSGVATALLFALAAAGVALLQPGLARVAHAAGERDDVYALPPPGQLHAATLGWDAAAVDLLWSKLLVEYGTHWSERHEFLDTPHYADAILELEPDYAPLYRYVDTMLVYRPMRGTADDARAARAYLERGTRERPTDSKVWLEYGQFQAFIGSSFLSDPEEQAQWRRAGADAIGHAVELGAYPDRALTAANILSKAGQTELAIRYLERAYAFTEHPSMAELHESIGQKLQMLRQMRATEP